jgi:tetratricopeptide (TPR) repeat protein
MASNFLSHFTPSLMSPEALESIFVQREGLAQLVIQRIRDGTSGKPAEHTLLVGPRGIGKTHLVSLVYYRLLHQADADKRAVAWLREEEWGVTSVLDVLLRILRSLLAERDNPDLAEQVQSLYTPPSDVAESQATEKLREIAGSRTLLILVENLDALFRGLGEPGQHRLRTWLRENPFCMLLATSQTIIPGLSRSTSPFYAFFRIHDLEGLSLDDGTLLLSKIASFAGNPELASFLPTPAGRARIRALNYLAGGNHRAYVIFSQFLTRGALEDLVEPLARTIDDLTPYYQSRMASLLPEQRKVIEFVCESRAPVSAHEVEKRCFMSHGAAVAHLSQLREMGYLRALALGRERYYELREPLMRLSIEVKEHRGKPIRLLVEFLRLWYSPGELRERLAGLPLEAGLERKYATPALQLSGADRDDPRISGCCHQYSEAVEEGDYEKALQAVEELIVMRENPQDWFAQACCLASLGRAAEAMVSCDLFVELDPSSDAWTLRASLLHNLGQHEMALAACDKALELQAHSARAHAARGEILLALGRPEEALASLGTAVSAFPGDSRAHLARGMALSDLGRYEEALTNLAKAVELDPANPRAHVYRGAALIELKRSREGLASADTAIAVAPGDPLGWVLRGTALSDLGEKPAALEAFNRAAAAGDSSSFLQYKRAELLLAIQNWREGSQALDHALQRFAHSESPDCGNTTAILIGLSNLLPDASRLSLVARLVLLVYQKNDALPALAHGLVESISSLAGATAESARTWNDLWHSEAASHSEFRLPLRLLRAAAGYLETRDLRSIIELPQEERLVLEPLLGVQALETA